MSYYFKNKIMKREINLTIKQLTKQLTTLNASVYWIIEGGEFSDWVSDKLMPVSAAKELIELKEQYTKSVKLLKKIKSHQFHSEKN